MNTVEFLDHIYEQQCKVGDYVVLSSKKGPQWRDHPLKYDTTFKEKLVQFFQRYPAHEYDLYWSPMPYSKPNRQISNSIDTKFLAQDIDEHEDPSSIDPKPTYIWESSPNKYQGLWELDRYITEKEYTPLNEALAKHGGFDDCWDFPHVYRIPGTHNHKYKNKPKVSEVTASKRIWRPKELTRMLNVQKAQAEAPTQQSSNMAERRIYAKYAIPQKVKELLALEDISSLDRSSTIWYIENNLIELGMEPQEVITLIQGSAFNKYRGRKDEVKRLTAELSKIIEGEPLGDSSKDVPSLRVSSYEDLMGSSNTFGGWLVENIWGNQSHGIVAGMPKSYKSTLVHDLIISVASGRPFLDQYKVLNPGPVVVVQNENSESIMRDRSEKMISAKGIVGRVKKLSENHLNLEFPRTLPIHFINQQGFSMSNEKHRSEIEAIIREIKPALVVFDPLYLMFEGDINSAQDLNPTLNWLLQLKKDMKTSVMVVHHYNKGGPNSTKGGARMAGSIFLYGWIESAWYLTKDEEDPTVVSLTREFRMAQAGNPLNVRLTMGEIGDPAYHVEVTEGDSFGVSQQDLEEEVLNLLKHATQGVPMRQISERIGIDRNTTKTILKKLMNLKQIDKVTEGYIIYK